MENINVEKSKLLVKLERNLNLHNKVFKETLTAFKKNYFKELQKMVADAKKNKFGFHVNLSKPVNYAQNYKDAIKMIEMDCRDIIVLSQDEFMCYVLNKWNWLGSFKSSYMINMGLSGTSGSSGSSGSSGTSGATGSVWAREYFGDVEGD